VIVLTSLRAGIRDHGVSSRRISPGPHEQTPALLDKEKAMSNFVFARTLTTGATVAALATGILTISVAAYAHGVGNQTGGGGMKGVPTITANKVTTTKSMDHSYWRRLQLIDAGYTGPTYSCFYRHTPGGLSRVCGDIN